MSRGPKYKVVTHVIRFYELLKIPSHLNSPTSAIRSDQGSAERVRDITGREFVPIRRLFHFWTAIIADQRFATWSVLPPLISLSIMATTATKRIQKVCLQISYSSIRYWHIKELIELQRRELQGVTIGIFSFLVSCITQLTATAPVSDDNLLEWKGTILGPHNTAYKVKFPAFFRPVLLK